MKIEKKLVSPKYYGDKRSTDDIMYIVIQERGNKATPHYHIISGEAIQAIPDEYLSDAVNGPRLSFYGYLHGISNKYNSISIGVPSKMSEEDKQMCLNLIMTIKQRYKIKDNNIIRQMDVTGEINPEEWHDNEKWKKDIRNKLIEV